MIKKVNLEQVFRPRSPELAGYPVYVLDFRVALHAITATAARFAEAAGLKPFEPSDLPEARADWAQYLSESELWLPYARAQWGMRLNRGPDMLPKAKYRVVVVDDSKAQAGYWRNLDDPGYKGTRPKTRDLAYKSAAKVGHELVAELNLPFYSEPLYEADDWAGVIHRAKLSAEPGSLAYERELYYGTVDSDWLQLVDDRTRQMWANTGPWPSRLKNEAETRAYVLKRMGERITKPSEIALVKQKCGDSADNLEPGSSLHLFDLVNPNPAYDLANTSQGLQLAAELDDPTPNNRLDVLAKSAKWLNAYALPITLLP